MTTVADVLVAGRWRGSTGDVSFDAYSPASGETLGSYPTSPWGEVDAALDAGAAAYRQLSRSEPEEIAAFLEGFADVISEAAAELAEIAEMETALPATPRFDQVEIPRTVGQLRLAAKAARERSWVDPVLSPEQRIASRLAPIPGVVCVFGPNNFPFAFNGVSGGDFAAAIATGHPVVAKANPGHPETTRRLAVLAALALAEVGLPPATVQMIYRTSHEDGARMVGDPRVAATAYTGSRSAGLALKRAADEAGKPIYLEMSSVNPVLVLEGAIEERGAVIAEELAGSLLLGSGQFCTSPGLVFAIDSDRTEAFFDDLAASVARAPAAPLLGFGVAEQLTAARERWERAGARARAEGEPGAASASYPNTVMKVAGEDFLRNAEELQTEAFGNMSMTILVRDIDELVECLAAFEANLTGTIYSATDGSDDGVYRIVEPLLREKVGRLLNDKAPTGVAVVAAMNHGGPYPATGHPGFTAVGIPASLRRFGMLQCYDNVADGRLPAELQADNPLGLMRRVDDQITDAPVRWGSPLED